MSVSEIAIMLFTCDSLLEGEGMRQTDKSVSNVPLEFSGDQVIWATWLYFAENKTQNEVARELGVSRATIANYLTEAKKRGMVSVAIAPDLLGNIETGRVLAKNYGLAHAHVVPTPEVKLNAGQLLRERLGVAAAHVLRRALQPNSIVGVSSGRTVLATGQALGVSELPNVKVVQVAGSSISGDNISPEYCTALIAGKLGAQSINLYAPAILSSKKLCTEILNEPSLRGQFRLIEQLDIILFGVSGIQHDMQFADSEFVTREVIQHYIDQHAIGVVLGRFVDSQGRETKGPLEGRIVGMKVGAMKNVANRIMVAGGADKISIIRTMLEQGLVTHLITDLKTAEALVS